MTEYAMMRAKLEEAYQELRKTIKYLNERQEKFLAMIQRERNLTREPLEALRKRIFQEIRNLDERISGEEL